MLPAIPVMLKTAATSIAKQAAVDAASGALSSTAKNKLSKVTQPNSETRKLEHEFSKNFKELEEVNTSDGVLALQDSFNSKLESIVSTSDEQTSRLIDAVKDANKATAESINSNIENLREDISVLSRNVEAVNANIESVGQMTTLAAEASAQNIGTGSNFISDVVGSVKNVIQTILGGAILSINGMFQAINRKLNDTPSEEGGDKTGMSGLEIVGDEETKTLKNEMDKAYDDFKAAERVNVISSTAYATQFRDGSSKINPKALVTAFESPEKALEIYNKDKSHNEQIDISNNNEENFINLVKANRNLKSGDKGYIPFNKTILNASDEELRTYYKEYKMVGEESSQKQILARREDYEAKKSEFEKTTEARKSKVSEKIRDKVLSLLKVDNMSSEEVLNKLTTDKDGKVINAPLDELMSYYSTDKGRKKNEYNLSQESIDLYEKVIPNLVSGLKSYINANSLSTTTEGSVTVNSSDSDFLKYIIGQGGELKNSSFFGKTDDSEVFNGAIDSIRDSKLRLINSEGMTSKTDLGFANNENELAVVNKAMDKYDDIYLVPTGDKDITEEDKRLMERYNGISTDELIAKLEEINQNVTSSAALNAEITLKSTEATSKAIENSGKNSQTFYNSGNKDMDGVQ